MLTTKRLFVLCLILCLLLAACSQPEQEPEPSRPSQTDASEPSEPSASTQPEDASELLVGTWTGLQGQGNCLYTNTIYFLADGTFAINDYDYIYQPFPDGQWDWGAGGRGYVTTEGTYRLEGSILYLTYCFNDMDDFEDYTHTFTISRLDGSYLVIDDDFGTYINEAVFPWETLQQLCELLDVPYEPEIQEGC